MQGEPFEEQVAPAFGGAFQFLQVWPGTLGVYVVGGNGRDAAPVVDPGFDVPQIWRHAVRPRIRQVRWRLDRYVRRQQQPGEGDGGEHVVFGGFRPVSHTGARLCPKVLDDALLNVSVTLVQVPDLEYGVHPLLDLFPDSNEYSRRERHRLPSGCLKGLQPSLRHFVRRSPVGQVPAE